MKRITFKEFVFFFEAVFLIAFTYIIFLLASSFLSDSGVDFRQFDYSGVKLSSLLSSLEAAYPATLIFLLLLIPVYLKYKNYKEILKSWALSSSILIITIAVISENNIIDDYYVSFLYQIPFLITFFVPVYIGFSLEASNKKPKHNTAIFVLFSAIAYILPVLTKQADFNMVLFVVEIFTFYFFSIFLLFVDITLTHSRENVYDIFLYPIMAFMIFALFFLVFVVSMLVVALVYVIFGVSGGISAESLPFVPFLLSAAFLKKYIFLSSFSGIVSTLVYFRAIYQFYSSNTDNHIITVASKARAFLGILVFFGVALSPLWTEKLEFNIRKPNKIMQMETEEQPYIIIQGSKIYGFESQHYFIFDTLTSNIETDSVDFFFDQVFDCVDSIALVWSYQNKMEYAFFNPSMKKLADDRSVVFPFDVRSVFLVCDSLGAYFVSLGDSAMAMSDAAIGVITGYVSGDFKNFALNYHERLSMRNDTIIIYNFDQDRVNILKVSLKNGNVERDSNLSAVFSHAPYLTNTDNMYIVSGRDGKIQDTLQNVVYLFKNEWYLVVRSDDNILVYNGDSLLITDKISQFKDITDICVNEDYFIYTYNTSNTGQLFVFSTKTGEKLFAAKYLANSYFDTYRKTLFNFGRFIINVYAANDKFYTVVYKID